MIMEYSTKTRKKLRGTNPGDTVEARKGRDSYTGILMPKSSGSPETVVIKLGSGYNIGIIPDKIRLISKRKTARSQERASEQKADNGKPSITIIHTGGTIASKIDYETGAVRPLINSQELIVAISELEKIASIKLVPEMQVFSEDIEPEHWTAIAKSVLKEVKAGAKGVIITHGTDTMHYTSAALSFMLHGIHLPVILVGAQRSSDRASSDAAMNLICAANFIVKSGFAGVGICMHGTMSDDYCLVHQGTRVRKMHTSRRDAFRSIDTMPIARIDISGNIKYFGGDYQRRSSQASGTGKIFFDRRVALVKTRPGFSSKELEFYEKSGYKGIVIEGTALGHMPVNVSDAYTKHHQKLLDAILRMVKKGVVILMASQTPYGTVNMNVYSTGRKLKDAGVIPVRMTPEAAYAKLGWALGNEKKREKVIELLETDIAGEIMDISDPESFLN